MSTSIGFVADIEHRVLSRSILRTPTHFFQQEHRTPVCKMSISRVALRKIISQQNGVFVKFVS